MGEPVPGSEEARRLASPSHLKIDFSPNLLVVVVQIGNGLSARDPLGQRGSTRHFKSLDEAIAALPDAIVAHLDEHHADAEERQLPDRRGDA